MKNMVFKTYCSLEQRPVIFKNTSCDSGTLLLVVMHSSQTKAHRLSYRINMNTNLWGEAWWIMCCFKFGRCVSKVRKSGLRFESQNGNMGERSRYRMKIILNQPLRVSSPPAQFLSRMWIKRTQDVRLGWVLQRAQICKKNVCKIPLSEGKRRV